MQLDVVNYGGKWMPQRTRCPGADCFGRIGTA
jgi:hypothetical protein